MKAVWMSRARSFSCSGSRQLCVELRSVRELHDARELAPCSHVACSHQLRILRALGKCCIKLGLKATSVAPTRQKMMLLLCTGMDDASMRLLMLTSRLHVSCLLWAMFGVRTEQHCIGIVRPRYVTLRSQQDGLQTQLLRQAHRLDPHDETEF